MTQNTLPEQINVDELPVVESAPLSKADERLLQRFTEIETTTIERLSAAGQRLVEWGTAALGVFFASLALLDNPRVLAAFQSGAPKWLGALAVALYLLALLCGFFAAIPLYRYRYSPHDMTQMEAVLQRAFQRKYRLVVVGSALFVGASLALGAMIVAILLAF